MKNETNISPSEYEFFLKFYEEYKNLIYHIAMQHETQDCSVDDLTHDVVLKLMNYIPSLMKINENKNQVVNYIALTVKSVHVDRIRACSARPYVLLPNERLEEIYEDNIDKLAVADLISTQLDIALLKKKLPERDWDILSGKYIIGYSDKELADYFGCSQDSIRMALTRARRHARKLLDIEGSDKNGKYKNK